MYQRRIWKTYPIAQSNSLYPQTSGRHESVIKFGQWENAVAFTGFVSFVDDLIGDLVKALDNRNLIEKLDSTMSDHGCILEKQHWGKGQLVRSTRVLELFRLMVIQDIKSLKVNHMVNLLDLHRLWLI